MGKNNNKQEQKPDFHPSSFVFQLEGVPEQTYISALNELFSDPDYQEMTSKRNRFVRSIDHMNPHSAEARNLMRTIMQYDRKLSDILFRVIVQCNVNAKVSYDVLPFSVVLRYFVDYSREGIIDKVDRLSSDLNKIMFIADMLESILTDVRKEMDDVFQGEVEFKSFDMVSNLLRRIKVFFNESQPSEGDIGELYMEYADSINNYLDVRMRTFSKKYRSFKPVSKCYTYNNIIDAVNSFFGTDGVFGKWCLGRTRSGGYFVDAMKLVANIDEEQTKKLDSVVKPLAKNGNVERYSYDITDAIMNAYSVEK